MFVFSTLDIKSIHIHFYLIYQFLFATPYWYRPFLSLIDICIFSTFSTFILIYY